MRVLSKFAIVAVFGMVISVIVPATAIAISPEQRKSIDSGAYYFNIDVGSTPICGPARIQNTSGGGELYMIGDSITEGAAAELQTAFTGAGYQATINGLSSRRLSEGSDPKDGLTVLAADIKNYPAAAVVVIALGTNGGVTNENIAKAIESVKASATSAKIFWVNIGVNNEVRNGADLDAATPNALLDTNSQTLNYTVIKWDAVVTANPGHIDPNPATGLGVHPAGEGITAFATTVVSGLVSDAGVGGQCVASQLSGSDNPEKIWNYLALKGLPPHIIAGFLGNMQEEANFNPRQLEIAWSEPPHLSDIVPACQNVKCQPGFGIIQWTAPGRKDGLRQLADSTGRAHSDLTAQLDMVWQEINQMTDLKDITENQYGPGTIYEVLMRTTTVEQASEVITRNYEIPDNMEYNVRHRQNLSRQWLIKFGSGTSTTTADRSNL
ncbi:MAG: phage tail tip lysozyme [bacterium]|nr:phage tail tip lysozyme [bacterium]